MTLVCVIPAHTHSHTHVNAEEEDSIGCCSETARWSRTGAILQEVHSDKFYVTQQRSRSHPSPLPFTAFWSGYAEPETEFLFLLLLYPLPPPPFATRGGQNITLL